jgi:16S rRNA (cytidine1402-2'-O)-methyltransferase
VFPIPGANAALSALIASGLGESSASDGENSAAFTFHGFLPAKEGQRRTALEKLLVATRATTFKPLENSVIPSGGRSAAAVEGPADGIPHIFYEAPHRILATLAEIEAIFGPAQHVVLARELTKIHEEFLRGAVSEVRKTLTERSSVKGEFVLLFAPTPVAQALSSDSSSAQPQLSLAAAVRALMQSENLSEMDALKRVARARGLSKSAAYREWQRSKGSKSAN